MVLVVQEKLNPETKSIKRTISAVEVNTGNIKALKQPECLEGQYQWVSDNEILAIEPSCTNETTSKVEKVSLSGKSETLLTFPNDIPEISKTYVNGSSTIKFSPDLSWLAFDKKPCCDGPTFTPKLYVYNLKDKSKKMLLEAEGLNLQGWNKDKIIFTRNQYEIWEVNPDGSGQKKIFEDNDPVQYSPVIRSIYGVIASKDGTKVIYTKDVGWIQEYFYDSLTSEKRMLVKQEFNKPPMHIILSPDNGFITYSQQDLDGPGGLDKTLVCYTKFLKDNKAIKTTTDECDYPSISH